MGIGIRVGRNASATSGTATITNNTITDYQKAGIVVDGAWFGGDDHEQHVTGAGPTTVVAQNGIQVSRQATATVSGNTVSANIYTGTQERPRPGSCSSALSASHRLEQHVRRQRRGHLLASCRPAAGATSSLRANTITGGDSGIVVERDDTATLIEANTTTGAATIGIDVGVQLERATPSEGNEASGASGDRQFRLPRRARSETAATAPRTSGRTTPARSRPRTGSALPRRRRSLRRSRSTLRS